MPSASWRAVSASSRPEPSPCCRSISWNALAAARESRGRRRRPGSRASRSIAAATIGCALARIVASRLAQQFADARRRAIVAAPIAAAAATAALARVRRLEAGAEGGEAAVDADLAAPDRRLECRARERQRAGARERAEQHRADDAAGARPRAPPCRRRRAAAPRRGRPSSSAAASTRPSASAIFSVIAKTRWVEAMSSGAVRRDEAALDRARRPPSARRRAPRRRRPAPASGRAPASRPAACAARLGNSST